LHPLRGGGAGYWSVTALANSRITFRFEEGDATDVDLVDDHEQDDEEVATEAQTVIPAGAKRRAGIQKSLEFLDSRVRGNDEWCRALGSSTVSGAFSHSLQA
jgi:hypothetical protein